MQKKDPLKGLSRTKSLWTQRQASNTPRDMYWVYEFLRRLSTPFIQWPAFKVGIIDRNGNILVGVDQLTAQQKKAWGYIDALSVGIKKLVDRVPNTKQKLATITGTMLLMREAEEATNPSAQQLTEHFDVILNNLVLENLGAINAASTGNIAAIGIGPQGEPPKSTALLKRIKRRNNRRERDDSDFT